MKIVILISTLLGAVALAAPGPTSEELAARAPATAVINGHGGTLVDGARVHYVDGVPSIVYTTHTPSE
ncbi:hypothetical protein H0H87_001857 [Tephrocybe sp. NHM501043]|nr:hypothetical protein H0H87_001857 [Tephrocybe sp. NHM501043]